METFSKEIVRQLIGKQWERLCVWFSLLIAFAQEYSEKKLLLYD